MTIKETILSLANRYAREYMTFKEPEARDVLIAAIQAEQDYTRAVLRERDQLRKELAELRLQAISDLGQEIERLTKVDVEPVHFCDYGYEGWGKIDASHVADNISYGMTVETYYPASAIAALRAADAEVERLKTLSNTVTTAYEEEVADSERVVDALKAENEKLRDALKPFARAYLNYTIENVDAARAALGDGK